MEKAPKHPNEKQRLESLRALNILDSLPEKDFDQITLLASQICGTPVALISIVDGDRQWFKSKVGVSVSETPRDVAFCAHAILSDNLFVIENAKTDYRFSDNPLVTDGPQIQFYAGAPLMSPDGYPIGTVCVIDTTPRSLTAAQKESLKALSDQITRLLELKVQIKKLENAEEGLIFKTTALANITEGIVLQDAEGIVMDYNPAALSVLNISAETLKDRVKARVEWEAVYPDGSRYPHEDYPARACLRTGKKQINVIMGIPNSTEEMKWFKVSAVPLFLNEGTTPSHVVTSFVDITQQFENQMAIEKKQKELRFVLDSVPHMVSLWSANLININANKAYSEYFDKSQDEIKGRQQLYKKQFQQ